MSTIAPPTPENQHIPYFEFEGDETIGPEAYARCVEERDSPLRKRYAPLFAGCMAAAEVFGIKPDPQTAETWKRIVAATGPLDKFLDDSPDREEALKLYYQGLNYMQGKGDEPELPGWADLGLETTVRLLKNAFVVLPEERRETLLDAGEAIGKISAKKAACTDLHEYIDLLCLEGLASGILITRAVTDEVYTQPSYVLFGLWFDRAMELATLLDSARDLERDSQAGLTGVEFTPDNRRKIIAAAEPSATTVLHSNFGRKAIWEGVVEGYHFFKGQTT